VRVLGSVHASSQAVHAAKTYRPRFQVRARPSIQRLFLAVAQGGEPPVEDKRPLCQLSSKRLEDNWLSGLLSSTKHRLSGMRSPDSAELHSASCPLSA